MPKQHSHSGSHKQHGHQHHNGQQGKNGKAAQNPQHQNVQHPQETENMTQQQEQSQAQEQHPAEEHEAQAVSPQERIAQLETEIEELKKQFEAEKEDLRLRAAADLQNAHNRAQREVSDAHQYGLQKFAKDIVEGAENLERAIASLPVVKEGETDIVAVVDKMRDGLKSTERSLVSILERHGITRHDAKDHTFDPNEHQAMQEVASPDHAPGQVVQAWSPTWKLNKRLLKPAMVVVANDQSTGTPK